jgi:hypothetical protein
VLNERNFAQEMIDLQNANSNDKPKLAEIGITSLKK